MRHVEEEFSMDKLDRVRQKGAQARDLEFEIADLAAQMKAKTEELNRLYHNDLVLLFDEAGIDTIGIPADGNKPAVDYEMKPFYSANIAAKWEQPKKDAAFKLLKDLKQEALIKTEVSAKLPKGNLKAAKQIIASIKKLKIKGAAIDFKQSVHSGTLCAWLKDTYERGQSLKQDQLDKIGASVGRYVKAKDRKE